MLRRATHPRPGSPLAAIRAHFELPQAEMAHLLRVSDAYYRLLEAGKRNLTLRHLELAAPLSHWLERGSPPAPAPELDPPPPAVPPPYQAAHLHLRVRLYRRYQLQGEAPKYARRVRAAAHWRAALPTLRAHPAFAEARAQQWLAERDEAPLPLEERIAWQLLDARIAGLEAEAVGLRALLAAAV
ncbi:MAG: hypothetical protein H7330_09420 [Hymenobacteraceae bacterium]|nr:hypothetical protein [Hymenobacteraceae bacterium]